MRRTLLVLLAMFIGAIIGILQPVHGQEYNTLTVVCAQCDGAAFGATGQGMVVMSSRNGGGSLWFYPLDRSQAVPFTPNYFGATAQLQTNGHLIGRFSNSTETFVWNEKTP